MDTSFTEFVQIGAALVSAICFVWMYIRRRMPWTEPKPEPKPEPKSEPKSSVPFDSKAVRSALAQIKTVKPLEKVFEVRFKGDHLELGGRQFFKGLPDKEHILEITIRDQCYIDGIPRHINAGDLNYIKSIFRGVK